MSSDCNRSNRSRQLQYHWKEWGTTLWAGYYLSLLICLEAGRMCYYLNYWYRGIKGVPMKDEVNISPHEGGRTFESILTEKPILAVTSSLLRFSFLDCLIRRRIASRAAVVDVLPTGWDALEVDLDFLLETVLLYETEALLFFILVSRWPKVELDRCFILK